MPDPPAPWEGAAGTCTSQAPMERINRNKKEEGQRKKHEQSEGAYQRGHDRGIKQYGFSHHRLVRTQLQHSADVTLDLIIQQLLQRRAVGVRSAVILPHRVRPLHQRHDPAAVKGVEHPHPVKAIPYELLELLLDDLHLVPHRVGTAPRPTLLHHRPSPVNTGNGAPTGFLM